MAPIPQLCQWLDASSCFEYGREHNSFRLVVGCWLLVALEKLPTSPGLITGEPVYHQRKARFQIVGADFILVGLCDCVLLCRLLSLLEEVPHVIDPF